MRKIILTLTFILSFCCMGNSVDNPNIEIAKQKIDLIEKSAGSFQPGISCATEASARILLEIHKQNAEIIELLRKIEKR